MGKGASKAITSHEEALVVQDVKVEEDPSLLHLEDVSVTMSSFARLPLCSKVRLVRVIILRDGRDISSRLAGSRLTSLNVKATKLDLETFFSELPDNNMLSSLKLSCLVPDSLFSAAMLSRLTVLRLANAELKNQQLQQVVDAIKDGPLQSLDVSNNELENDCVAVLKPLLNRLRRINLGGNNFTEEKDLFLPLLSSGGPLVVLGLSNNNLL
jgi:hypothetical protein